MPFYDFNCPQHGLFDEMRSFSTCSEPAACPTCGSASARVITVPHFSGMDRGTKAAHAVNERSRHEPEVHKGALHQHQRFHVHKHGEHCGHAPAGSRESQASKAERLHSYQGPRPWVMEHGAG